MSGAVFGVCCTRCGVVKGVPGKSIVMMVGRVPTCPRCGSTWGNYLMGFLPEPEAQRNAPDLMEVEP